MWIHSLCNYILQDCACVSVFHCANEVCGPVWWLNTALREPRICPGHFLYLVCDCVCVWFYLGVRLTIQRLSVEKLRVYRHNVYVCVCVWITIVCCLWISFVAHARLFACISLSCVTTCVCLIGNCCKKLLEMTDHYYVPHTPLGLGIV